MAFYSDPHARRLARHLHALGPRPGAELLHELTVDEERLLERLEFYARFNPQQVAELRARDWLDFQPRRVA